LRSWLSFRRLPHSSVIRRWARKVPTARPRRNCDVAGVAKAPIAADSGLVSIPGHGSLSASRSSCSKMSCEGTPIRALRGR
jgi:hypothetical protein